LNENKEEILRTNVKINDSIGRFRFLRYDLVWRTDGTDGLLEAELLMELRA